MHVRTPCIGMCSTTFGDVVCRGCKRWLHEIVGWNAFDDAQKQLVAQRLGALRDASVAVFVRIDDVELTRTCGTRVGLGSHFTLTEVLLGLLRRDYELQRIGAVALPGIQLDGHALYKAIDDECLLRAEGLYEQSQRVQVR